MSPTIANTGVVSAVVFEPEYLSSFRDIYEEKIVFNKLLGLKIVSVTPDEVVARIDMRPDLVGHYAYNRIHGGVISARCHWQRCRDGLLGRQAHERTTCRASRALRQARHD
jgi:hypothetical protein